MHPIIKAYTEKTGESLLEELDKLVDKSNILEKVIHDFIKETTINSGVINQKLVLNIDEAVIKGHQNSDVYLLFIYFSILYCDVHNIPEKTKILYSIGLSSLNEKTTQAIQECMLHAKILLKQEEGNQAEAKKLMYELVSKADKNSPRYYGKYYNYAMILANSGTLKELSPNILPIEKYRSEEKLSWNNSQLSLANNIMIGDFQAGLLVIEEFKKKYKNSKLNLNPFKKAIWELNILSGDFKEANYPETALKLLVGIYNNLNQFKMLEASKQFKHLQDIKYDGFQFNKLTECLPFHIELGLGNIGKTRLMLKEKSDKGNWQYLDDLFYGRLHLLEKNNRKTNEAFTRLMENINRYGAMNRLIFELQFAKEMNIADILNLTHGWKQAKKSNSVRLKRQPAPQLKPTAKGVDLLIGNSQAIHHVIDLVKKYAPLKAPVLITGETGTGKELVSRAIHDEGPNPQEPFLAINCGGLSDTLLQSELFGYVAGAFTGAQKEHKGIFEVAGKGTVFLDEFGDISPLLQVSLLRVLESNEIRMLGGTKNQKIACRIIMATNTNLQNAVSEKKFREDLYFRITRFQIRIPALRERIEDLPLLIDSFLNKDKDESEVTKKLSKELLDALSLYRWPGNVRELKNEIERLKILHFEKEILNIENFPFNQLQGYIPQIPKVVSTTQDNPDEGISQSTGKNESEDEITSDYVVNIIQRGSKVERRISFIKDLFRQYKRLTRSQIIEIAKVNPSTATKELQMLCDERFIVRHTPTKSTSTYYFEIIE